MSNVPGSPTISKRTSRRRGSILSTLSSSPADETRKGEALLPQGTGARRTSLCISQEGAFALHSPQSCWKSAKVMTSESERRLRDS
jgi:hypothetical protein